MTAREVAFRVVRRVSDGAYADRAFRAEAARARLSPADRAFAQVLAYGTIQRRLTLDHVIAQLSDRPLSKLDPPLLDALRIGIYQLLFMDSVPDHAAVAETVELAKSAKGAGYKFANAVLRRATREGRRILDAVGDENPASAAIRHSHPQWLVERWWADVWSGNWKPGEQAQPVSNWGGLLGACVPLFPALALGLSGFELTLMAMPLVRGKPDDNPAKPRGQIRNTRIVASR